MSYKCFVFQLYVIGEIFKGFKDDEEINHVQAYGIIFNDSITKREP